MKANPGNFLAILGLVSEYDKIVHSRLMGLDGMGSKNPSNAKYTSHSIQNELIHTAADIILETISAECGQPSTSRPYAMNESHSPGYIPFV